MFCRRHLFIGVTVRLSFEGEKDGMEGVWTLALGVHGRCGWDALGQRGWCRGSRRWDSGEDGLVSEPGNFLRFALTESRTPNRDAGDACGVVSLHTLCVFSWFFGLSITLLHEMLRRSSFSVAFARRRVRKSAEA